MLTKSKEKNSNRGVSNDKRWETIATIGLAIVMLAVGYAITQRTNAAMSTSRPSVSRSYTPSSVRSTPIRTTTSIPKTTSVQPKKITPIKSLSPTSATSANSIPKAPVITAKKKKKSASYSGYEYDYYAFADCVPFASANFNGWKCIDRD